MRLLSFIDGKAGYGAIVAGGAGSQGLRLDGRNVRTASADNGLEEGRARLATETGELEVSWSPAGPVLEFGMADAVIGAHAIAVSGSDEAGSIGGPGVAWELPESGFATLRTIWATTAKGALLLLVSMREVGAAEHGEELIGAARLLPDAEPYGYVEPLLSTEYAADGSHCRATLELWASTEEHVPERGAGVRVAGGALDSTGGRLETARFDWSLDGTPAVGAYEILTA